MNRMVILLALACAAGGAGAAGKQEVYKWTDANGVVHFSDAPPPQDTKNVQSLRLTGAGASAAPEQPQDGAAAGPAVPGAAPVAPANSADEAALCKQSRANLELLQGKTPVGIAGTDGKPQELDDKAREAQIVNAKLAISRFCK